MLIGDQFKGLGLKIYQPEGSYRYNEDSLLLAGFLKNIKKGSLIADLGAGSGLISLITARRFEHVKIYAVEIQKEIFSYLVRNIEYNNLSESIIPLNEDYRNIYKKYHQFFDLVITNPPYRKPDEGRVSRDIKRAISRHETLGTLEELLLASCRILKDKGRICLSYLAERAVDLFYFMREFGLEPKRVLPVYPFSNKNANLIIVEAIKKGGRGLTILPPFFRRDTASSESR